ncbi:MBL fold metallo-hydrolase [Paenibacillus sp. CAU 1782]
MSQTIKMDVWGGAGEHGRSCYRLQAGRISVLLDCGGKKENGGIYPRLDTQQIQELKTVFLSHVHEDHMAALPLLLQHGYTGEVWLTRETYRQLPAYASAWESYVKAQGRTMPYDIKSWEKLRFRFMDEETTDHQWLTIQPGLRFCWGPSGHMPGSVWLLLDLDGELAYYSGDYSSESTLLRASMPEPQLLEGREIQLAIIDAAYSDAPHTQEQNLIELIQKLKQVHTRGGHALLPVPASGRGLDLIVELSERLPGIPLAAEASLVREWKSWLHPSADRLWLREDMKFRLAGALANVREIAAPEERARLVQEDAHIILSPDGMMLAEPARTYSAMLRDDARNAVMFTGHLSADAAVQSQWAYEEFYCRYKVHQGLPDVMVMLQQLKPLRVLLVHAGVEATRRLEGQLEKSGLFPSIVREEVEY